MGTDSDVFASHEPSDSGVSWTTFHTTHTGNLEHLEHKMTILVWNIKTARPQESSTKHSKAILTWMDGRMGFKFTAIIKLLIAFITNIYFPLETWGVLSAHMRNKSAAFFIINPTLSTLVSSSFVLSSVPQKEVHRRGLGATDITIEALYAIRVLSAAKARVVVLTGQRGELFQAERAFPRGLLVGFSAAAWFSVQLLTAFLILNMCAMAAFQMVQKWHEAFVGELAQLAPHLLSLFHCVSLGVRCMLRAQSCFCNLIWSLVRYGHRWVRFLRRRVYITFLQAMSVSLCILKNHTLDWRG